MRPTLHDQYVINNTSGHNFIFSSTGWMSATRDWRHVSLASQPMDVACLSKI